MVSLFERRINMELNDIQELINKDENARKKVDEAHQLKFDIKQKIANEKKSISEQAWIDVKKEVDQIKEELDQGIQQAAHDNDANFQEVSKNIEEVFQTKKDEWCETILKHCLD